MKITAFSSEKMAAADGRKLTGTHCALIEAAEINRRARPQS